MIEEKDQFKYPHEKLFSLQKEDSPQYYAGSQDKKESSKFRKRFPWLKFQEEIDDKRYSYLGRNTEANYNHMISFGIEKIQSVSKTVYDQIQELYVGWTSNFKEEKQDLNKQKLFKLKEKTDKFLKNNDQSMLQIDCVLRGYMLTGIARPNVTVNEIYDTFFPTSAYFQKEQIQSMDEESENSVIDQAEYGYIDEIQSSWDYKRQSYEYHWFMCQIYKDLIKRQQFKIQKQSSKKQQNNKSNLKHKQLKQTLFNYRKARKTFYKGNICIGDEQYYNYFYAVISNYYQQILESMQLFQRGSKNTKLCEIRLNQLRQPLRLTKINYQGYVNKLLNGTEINKQSRQNMVKHHRHYHQEILKNFKFYTKTQKMKKIQKLQQNDPQSQIRINLVPLVEKKDDSPPSNYLILVSQAGKNNFQDIQNEYNISNIIANRFQAVSNESSTGSGQQQIISIADQMFQYMRRIFINKQPNKKMSQWQQHISFNPIDWLFSQHQKQENKIAKKNSVNPCFENILSRSLGLDILPLTHQQKLLSYTPNTIVDIYAVLEQLFIKIDAISKNEQNYNKIMKKMFKNLSSSVIKFNYIENADQKQNQIDLPSDEDAKQSGTWINHKDLKSQLNISKKPLSSKQQLYLLQLSMMTHQFSRQCPCLTNKGVPYDQTDAKNVQQELYQRLTLLLIWIEVIDSRKVEYSILQDSWKEMKSEFQGIINSYNKKKQNYCDYTSEFLPYITHPALSVKHRLDNKDSQLFFKRTLKIFAQLESKLSGQNQMLLRMHILMGYQQIFILTYQQYLQTKSLETVDYLKCQKLLKDKLQIILECIHQVRIRQNDKFSAVRPELGNLITKIKDFQQRLGQLQSGCSLQDLIKSWGEKKQKNSKHNVQKQDQKELNLSLIRHQLQFFQHKLRYYIQKYCQQIIIDFQNNNQIKSRLLTLFQLSSREIDWGNTDLLVSQQTTKQEYLVYIYKAKYSIIKEMLSLWQQNQSISNKQTIF